MQFFFRDFWWRWRFLHFGKVWKRSDQSSRKDQNGRIRAHGLIWNFFTNSELRFEMNDKNYPQKKNFTFLWSFWIFDVLTRGRHKKNFGRNPEPTFLVPTRNPEPNGKRWPNTVENLICRKISTFNAYYLKIWLNFLLLVCFFLNQRGKKHIWRKYFWF